MLGATEFTFIGNVLMGVMAIGGFCAMLYGVGSSMTEASSHEWKGTARTEPARATFKKAA